jgi:hypothetical protein
VAAGIVGHALLWRDAYEGDHLPPRATVNWGRRAETLAHYAFVQHGRKSTPPAKFLVWFADGSYRFCDSVDKALGAYSDPKTAGAVIMLDLASLGNALLARADRPLAHVEEPT